MLRINFKYSGKCADIFAFAIKYLEKDENDNSISKIENEIKERIKKSWPEADVQKSYNQIAEILKSRDLLTVFSLDSGAFEIDIAILTSLLKGILQACKLKTLLIFFY